MNPRKAGCILAAFLIAFVPLALAQGAYTQIDVPGAIQTAAYGLDTAGDISGYYVDSGNQAHGFLFSGGIYTTIDYPGAGNTILNGINDSNQIVGFTYDPVIGFIYNIQTQVFSSVSCPHATATYPYAINGAGTVVGTFTHGDNSAVSGFELVGAAYRRIEPASGGNTFANGIDASGLIVGDSAAGNFLFKGGTYRRLRIPNANGAVPVGIGPAGNVIVGYYEPLNSFVGYIFQNKVVTTLQFPASTETVATGINAVGEVVGYFLDASNVTHGFTWTPPADAAKK